MSWPYWRSTITTAKRHRQSPSVKNSTLCWNFVSIQLCDEVIRKHSTLSHTIIRKGRLFFEYHLITLHVDIEGSYRSKLPSTIVLPHFSIIQMNVDGRLVTVLTLVSFKRAREVTRSWSTNISRHNSQIINIFISLCPGQRRFNINRLNSVPEARCAVRVRVWTNKKKKRKKLERKNYERNLMRRNKKKRNG